MTVSPKELFLAGKVLASVPHAPVHLLRYLLAEQFYEELSRSMDTGDFSAPREQALRYGSQTIGEGTQYHFDVLKRPGDIDLYFQECGPVEDLSRFCHWLATKGEGHILQFGYGCPDSPGLRHFRKHKEFTRQGEHHVTMFVTIKPEMVAEIAKTKSLPYIRLTDYDRGELEKLLKRDKHGVTFQQEAVQDINRYYQEALTTVSSELAARIQATPHGIPLALSVEARMFASPPPLPSVPPEKAHALPRMHPALELVKKFFALVESPREDDKFAGALVDFNIRYEKLQQLSGLPYERFDNALSSLITLMAPAQAASHEPGDQNPYRIFRDRHYFTEADMLKEKLLGQHFDLAMDAAGYLLAAETKPHQSIPLDFSDAAVERFCRLKVNLANAVSRGAEGMPAAEQLFRLARPLIVLKNAPPPDRPPGIDAFTLADFLERLRPHMEEARAIAAERSREQQRAPR